MIQKPSGPIFMWVIYLNRFSSNLEDKTKQLVRANLQGLSSPATHMLLCNKGPIGVNKPFPSMKTHTHIGEIPIYPNTLALFHRYTVVFFIQWAAVSVQCLYSFLAIPKWLLWVLSVLAAFCVSVVKRRNKMVPPRNERATHGLPPFY